MKTSIIIPNWNGEKLLRENLPRILETGADEVIVVDDASSDGSAKILQEFGAIKFIQQEKNLGFVRTVNRGVEAAKGEIVVLLNNDAFPEKDFLEPLLDHFKKEDIFAVSCNEPTSSWAQAHFNGFVNHKPGPKTDKTHISFWASGGSAAFSREKWNILAGMDSMYHPFYWEDIDLSYRAWKRGWKVLWEPRSIVHHEHGETIKKYFDESFRDYVSARNHLLFIWKNITSRALFSFHKKKLKGQLFTGSFWRPFLGALPYTPDVLTKRKIEKREAKISDEEIFGFFES